MPEGRLTYIKEECLSYKMVYHKLNSERAQMRNLQISAAEFGVKFFGWVCVPRKPRQIINLGLKMESRCKFIH